MSKHIGVMLAIAIAAGAAGCATYPEITSRTVIVSGIGPVEVEHLTVRVVSVDRSNRSVIVEQHGNQWLDNHRTIDRKSTRLNSSHT